MTLKSIGWWAVIGLLLGTALAYCQELPPFPGPSYNPQAVPGVPAAPAPTPALPADPAAPIMGGQPIRQLSDWITGEKPGCCGPVGKHGLIDTEVYLRNGVTFPIQGAIFGETLDVGYVVQGGWRSLFFNVADTSAWVVDLSISNMSNGGRRPDVLIPLRNVLVPSGDNNQLNNQEVSVPLVGVTIRKLNRTFVNVGLGKEWYLLGTAHSGEPNLRVGFDSGGRWGSASLRTFELPHRNDVIGGVWAAVSSDVEVPYGGFVFQGGLRFEWDYTWSDILQRHNNSDMQDVNLMINFGFRY
jgi:hypothetical protein